MNTTEEQIIKFFNSGIRGEKISIKKNEKINWDKFLKYADEHKIKEIIYSSIIWNKKHEEIDKNILEEWKRETFFTAIHQMNHINQISYVIKELNKSNIDIMVLKGIIIRDFYPKPDLRTMSDADVLVHEKDMINVANVLEKLGYSKKVDSFNHGSHIVFIHPNHYPIEVHWTLTNKDFFRGNKSFEGKIWENATEINIKGGKAYALCLEDLAIHLCVHMAVHMAGGGFGIRQLGDLVLLVEKRGELINWGSFLKRIKECNIDKFVFIIFSTCHKLFNMKIPFAIPNEIKINSRYSERLIEEIFKDGVYGHGDISNTLAKDLAFNKERKNNFLKGFILFIFPPVSKMSNKYNYSKKYRILVPIAWIHHIFLGIFNNKYKLTNKIKFIFLTFHISKQKNKLLKWLEL